MTDTKPGRDEWTRFLSHSSDAYVSMGADGRIIDWNPRAEAMFGWSADEVEGRLLDEVLVPERLRDEHRRGLARYLQCGEGPVIGRPIEVPARRRDGTEVPVELVISVLPSVGSDPSFGAFLRDLTVRRSADARFRGLLDAAPDAMVGIDASGQIVFVNHQTERLFGYDTTDLIGQSIDVLISPDADRPGPGDGVDGAGVPTTPRRGAASEVEALRRDGSTFPAEVSLSSFKSDEGLIVTAAIRDATSRRADEAELREARDQLAAAQALAHIGSWSLDLASGAVGVSDEFRRIVGWGSHEALPDMDGVIEQFIVAEDRERVVEALASVITADAPVTIEVGVSRGSEVRRVSVYGTVDRSEAGEPLRIWGTAQDVTERRNAEAALADATAAMERERELVHMLQRAFLPRLPELNEVEVAAVYRPAGTEAVVGGDWYDVFELPGGDIGAVIGDVTGHGLAAAAVMAQLRDTARTLATVGYGPAQTLAALNSRLRQFEPFELATAIVLRLEISSGVLTWSVAGHPPLAIHGARTGLFMADRSDGPLLGVREGVVYSEHRRPLASGDLIVLYTDGLVERRGEPITAGLNRLGDAISAIADLPSLETVCDRLCDELLVGVSQFDDLCLLALRYHRGA